MEEDRQQFLKGMRYSEMSNVSPKSRKANKQLVMSADKRERGPRNDGLTGEPESLAGKITARDMGSRLPPPKTKAPVEIPKNQYVSEDRGTRKRKRDRAGDFSSVLDAAEYEGLRYRPKGPEGRQNFANILTLSAEVIGDVAHDILRSAADAALEIMKDEKIAKDFDKKKEIESLWGTTISQEQFNQLAQFSKRITDYDDDENIELRRREDELAEQYGVSMQVDEDEDEDRIDDEDDELSEEEELNVDIAEEAGELAEGAEEAEATTLVGESKAKRQKVDDNKVYAH